MLGAKAIVPATIAIVIILSVAGCAQDKTGKTSIPGNNSPTIFPAFGNMTDVDKSNYNDSYGLTAAQKMDAIGLALSNISVIYEKYGLTGLNNPNLTKYVKEVAITNSTEAMNNKLKYYYYDEGYLNVSALVASVPIIATITSDKYYHPFYVNAMVDLTHNQTLVIEEYSIQTPPLSDEVLLPPGSAWYHQLAGVRTVTPGNYTSILFRVRANASDIPYLKVAVVDGENFTALRNGSSYSPFTWKDALTNETRTINGAALPANVISTVDWYPVMAIPHESGTDDKYSNPAYYYVIVQNEADRTIAFDFYIGSYW